MKFEIEKDTEWRGYYPVLNCKDIYTGFWPEIADYLGISHVEYVNYIKQHGANSIFILHKQVVHPVTNCYYVFRTREECQKFIDSEELMPYLVMRELTK